MKEAENIWSKIQNEWRRVWAPYIITEDEDDEGDVLVHCPIHEDKEPSASVNFKKGAWHCYACGAGGAIENITPVLAERMDCVTPDGDECEVSGQNPCTIHPWVPSWVSTNNASKSPTTRKSLTIGLPSEHMIVRWHEDLMSDEDALEYLTFARGLTIEEIRKRKIIKKIGQRGITYGFPIYDESGGIANVRYYQPTTVMQKKHVWSVKGHGEARLYPLDALEGERHVYIVEGEFDALMLNSKGYSTITSTGGAGIGKSSKPSKKWKQEWNELFKDKIVYIIPDADVPGMRYAQHIKEELYEVAEEVCIVQLPFDIEDDHGDDISDYLIRDSTPAKIFNRLLQQARRHTIVEDMLADPAVNKATRHRWVQHIAETHYRREQMDLMWEEPETSFDFEDEMKAILPPMDYTIKDLHPTGGNSLIVSSYKVGKSTLLLNLVQSLVDDKPFLGKFPTNQPRGRVAFWNYEISRHQFREWVKTINVENKNRASVLTLRGKVLPLDVNEYYNWAVRWLVDRDVSVLIIDPYARAYGRDENVPSDVSEWLDVLDRLKEEANIDDLFMTAHTGRANQDQARGASRIEDWPDSLWYLSRDFDTRYFHAMGRDVDVPEGKLEFNPDNKHLKLVGGSKHQDCIDKIVEQMVDRLMVGPVRLSELPKRLTIGTTKEKMEAIEVAENEGTVIFDSDGTASIVRLPNDSDI